MTNPVILLGTQSNGETLPVQVNEFGQLVAEGLQGSEGQQGPKGDKGDKGDPGDPGEPGADGEGVPKPYGEEGSVLTIVDGAPSWASGPPEPEPEPQAITLTSALGDSGTSCSLRDYGLYNSSGNLTTIEDNWDEMLKTFPTWDTPTLNTREGLSAHWKSCNQRLSARFDFAGGLADVVTLRYKVALNTASPGYEGLGCIIEVTASTTHVSPIRNKWSLLMPPTHTPAKHDIEASFLLNRDDLKDVVFELKFDVSSSYPKDSGTWAALRNWELEDAGRFAVKRQAELEQRLWTARQAVAGTTDL